MTISLLVVLGISFACWKIHKAQATGIGQSNETYQMLNSVVQEWTDRYHEQGIKFKISELSDLILISFPTSDED